MHQASVGFHCPACAAGGSRSIVAKPVAAAEDAPQWATRTLIGLNLAAFAYSVATGGSLMSLDGSRALSDGGLFARLPPVFGFPGSVGVDTGEYYRLITSAFLHDGLLHLAFNLYALWLLGQLLELAFGRVLFILLYLASMLGGALGVMLLQPNAVTVGASGAVFGLLGAMALVQRQLRRNLWRTTVGTLLIINLALTLLIPGISIGGHFGGLIVGAAVGWTMLRLTMAGAPTWAPVLIGASTSLTLAAGAVLAASRWHDPILGIL